MRIWLGQKRKSVLQKVHGCVAESAWVCCRKCMGVLQKVHGCVSEWVQLTHAYGRCNEVFAALRLIDLKD